jgi:hypothetical protein
MHFACLPSIWHVLLGNPGRHLGSKCHVLIRQYCHTYDVLCARTVYACVALSHMANIVSEYGSTSIEPLCSVL